MYVKAGTKDMSPLFDQTSDLDCCIETGKVLAAMRGTSQDHWLCPSADQDQVSIVPSAECFAQVL